MIKKVKKVFIGSAALVLVTILFTGENLGPFLTLSHVVFGQGSKSKDLSVS